MWAVVLKDLILVENFALVVQIVTLSPKVVAGMGN
jgi:hypothetical protein